jgi:hypothetical protein
MHIAKVSFNTNGWKTPSGLEGKLLNNNYVGFFERNNGFGWEEWNFNQDRLIDKYYYGFLQGINNTDVLRGKLFANICLFTQHQNLQYYFVGYIRNVKALSFAGASIIRKSLGQYRGEMENNLRTVNANVRTFNNEYNSSINCSYSQFECYFNYQNMGSFRISLPNGKNSFNTIFELTENQQINLQRRIDIIMQSIN